MKRVLLLVVSILLILSAETAIYASAGAESNIISWTKSEPKIGNSLPASYNDVYSSMYCPVDYSDINIAGLSYSVNACMIHGENISFATYSRYGVAINFRNDKLMYPLNINCDSTTCTYLPQTDTLVMLQHKVNGIVFGLIVYKNFSDRLERHINPTNFSVSYSFNYGNPSYALKDANGYYWPVMSFAGSSNGRFLAVELRERGVGLLDVDKLSMRYITNNSRAYGRGVDPTIEFAVSNDGRFIAEMGRNAGLALFDVDDSCGEILTAEQMAHGTITITNPCPSVSTNYGFINNFREAYNPVFSPNGDSLSFLTTSYTVSPRKIELRASGYNNTKLDYLALGDSFSSGEGAELDSEYLKNTNTGFDKCHISNNSYPFILARIQKFDMNFVRSVACSGAVMDDVVGDDDAYWGQSSRIENYTQPLTVLDKNKLQLLSIDSFYPGQIHQEGFVSKYHPMIITLGIGGNDIGFADKLKACLGPDTCSWAGTPMGREMTAIEIKSIYDKLVRTYQSIHDDSPDSKLFAVGYPKLIYNTAECGGLTGHLLNADERKFINEGVHYLNQVIKAAAVTVGVGYIDIEDSLGKSALCGESPSAMNAIRLGDDSSIIDKLAWLKLIGNESFHPNTLGHAMIATKVSSSVTDLADYSYCPNDLVVCPTVTLLPEPGEYWVPDIYHNYPRQIKTDFAEGNTNDEDHKSLTLPDHTFAPNSEVTVTVASTEQTLGEYQASEDGSIDQVISLPSGLEPGFHTLNLYGTSFSNELIDLYQVFTYKMPEPDPVKQLDTTASHIIADDNGGLGTSQFVNQGPVTSNQTASADVGTQTRIVQPGKGSVLGDQDSRMSAPASSQSNTFIVAAVGVAALLIISLAIILYRRRR